MGKWIGSMNHNEYIEYYQRIFRLFFKLQQDLVQMVTKMEIFLIISFYAVRCSPNAVAWRNMVTEALSYHEIMGK